MPFLAVLGGAARGFNQQTNIQRQNVIQQQNTDIRKESLALQQRMQEQQKQTELDNLAREDFQRFADLAVETKTAALTEGKTEAEIAGVMVPLREQALANIQFRAESRAGATPETVQKEIQDFTTQFDTKVNSIVSPEAEAASEGRAEVAGAQAALESVAELPPAQQQAINQKLGFTDTATTDSFFRALDARERLLAEGKEGTEEFALVEQRLKSLAEGSSQGISIDVGPDGRVRVGLGGAAQGGLASELTGNQLFTQDQRVAEVNRAVGILDDTIERTITDPEDFGTIGSARETVQGVAAGLSDLSSLVSKSTGGVVDFNSMAESLQNALGVEDVFDPDLSKQQVLERELAMSLAKLRLSRGGSDVRAFSTVFQAAAKDVKLTGFTSSEAVKNRLIQIKEIFESEREAIASGLGGAEEPQVFEDMGDGTFKRVK